MKTTKLLSKALGSVSLSLLTLGLIGTAPSAHAESLLTGSSNDNQRSYLMAQTDPDEAYDPFTDYSEFDEASDEEADVNFFRNGRFFTLGLAAGYRSFTDNWAKTYASGPSYGIYLTYFFDLRSALAIGFITGDHAAAFDTNVKSYSGNVSFTTINFDYKYYFNTQNVTRGLAELNPYMLLGFAQYYRTYSIAEIEGFTRDSTMGVDLGAGFEIPLMRKKAFLGVQGCFHYVNFADETKDFLGGTERLKAKISGDMYDMLLILGLNF